MKVSVRKGVFDKISSRFTAVMILAVGVNNTGEHPEIIELLRDMEEFVKLTVGKKKGATISTEKIISENKIIGVGSSLAQMVSQIKLGGKILPINKIIDLCNFVSLKHMVAVSALDAMNVKPGLYYEFKKSLVLRDREKWLVKKLDVDVNEKAAVKKSSRHIIIHFESTAPMSKVEQIADELEMLLKIFFKAKTMRVIVNKKQPSASLID